MEHMPHNKTILLVDDDPIFLKGLMYTVKSLGYTVLTATGGREAVTVIEKEHVDVILSDINMPNGNGLQLLNYALKNSSIPVILMTGLSDLKEAQKALDLGARHFISKPFKKAEIAEALLSCDENNSTAPDPNALICIHLEEFLHGEELKYPVYMVKDDILVKVSNGGEALSPEDLASHRESGITYLFLKKSDYLDYVQFKKQGRADDVLRNQVISQAKESLLDFDYVKVLNPEAYERVSIQLLSTIDVLLENIQTSEILKKMCTSGDFLKRSAHVAIISSLIGHYLGTLSTRQFFNLMIAGLFHELGLLNNPLFDSTQKLESLNQEEKRIILKHAEDAARLLSKLNLFSDEVILMIEQHHEEESGTGYPLGLSSKFIHPMSRILAVGDSVTFKLENEVVNPISLPVIINDFTISSLGKYDLKVLEALIHVFKLSTPEEFVNYQLQDLLMSSEAI